MSATGEASVAREVITLTAPLQGYVTCETVRRAYLPAIISYEEGKGHVGALLARLMEEYDEVIVPGVLSERLAGMLERRGFHLEAHYSAAFDEYVDCFVWDKRGAEFAASMALTARAERGSCSAPSPVSPSVEEGAGPEPTFPPNQPPNPPKGL